MKTIISIVITTLFINVGFSQTVDVNYLNPKFLSTNYDFFRFGTEGQYYAGFMYNKVDANFGNGDDFSIFTYGDRDLTFRTGTGNVIFFPNSGGNIGIGTTAPSTKLHIIHSPTSGGVKIETGGSDVNTAKLQVLYNYNSSSASRNAAIELGRDVDDSGSYKWRLLANSGHSWGNMPTFSIQNLISGVYNTRFHIANDGNVGIGTTTPDNKLDVRGTIRANEVKVATGWSDFVFEPDYDLKSLEQVENFISENGHLPNIPSAEEVEENGISLGEMDAKLLQKIEELTLYVIELKKENEKQAKEIKALKNKGQ